MKGFHIQSQDICVADILVYHHRFYVIDTVHCVDELYTFTAHMYDLETLIFDIEYQYNSPVLVLREQ